MPEKHGTIILPKISRRQTLFSLLCCIGIALTPLAVHAAGKKTPELKKRAPAEILVDTIIASVNQKPITLRQLEQRLPAPRRLNLATLASDPEVRYVLDILILEQVVLDEAETRRLSAAEGEIDRYIEEVAARNNLSRSGFEEALQHEGKRLDDYKRQVKIEILKSKLTSALVQAGAGVTNQEIKTYIEDHPELSRSGSKVKLSQIFVSFRGKTFEQAREKIEQARRKLEAGNDFAGVARESSEGAEAAEGGLLGVLAEEDLNPVMFDTVFSLKDGEVSDITTSEGGFHIFKLIERIGKESDGNSRLEEEVRVALEKEKTARRIQDFFVTEIFKKHSIEKKI